MKTLLPLLALALCQATAQENDASSLGEVQFVQDANGPFHISLKRLSFQSFDPFQEPGYCMQSLNLIEPSRSRPFYQIATIFTKQPSCTHVFLPTGPTVSDFVDNVQSKAGGMYIPTQAVHLKRLPPSFKQFSFIAFAEYVRGVKAEVRQLERLSVFEKHILSVAGYQLQKLIGLDVDGHPSHIGVWVKPAASQNQRQSHYGITVADCMLLDQSMAQQGYTPVQFQVYGVGSTAYCAGIWENGHSDTSHRIQTGTDLAAMVSEMQGSGLTPVQLSSYTDAARMLNFVILWSSLQPHRYPGLWEETPAPVNYLVGSEEGFLPADLAKIDARIRSLMKDQTVMSLSYAISKDEKLKIAAAYGYSNSAMQTALTTENMFRVASISKPITSTAIFRLIEMGRLSLDRHVFGQGAIFGTRYGTKPYSDRVKALQLIHLLQHTEGGWSGREGDGYPDPMDIPMDGDRLISYVLDNHPLNFTAGVHYRYCNFGYFLLGKIIEKVTGGTYEQFVQRAVISPEMMSGAHVGYNGMAGRLPKEIVYSDHDGRVYAFDIERARGNAGWVSTAVALLKFAGGVDGFPMRRDLLQPSTLRQMTMPSNASHFHHASGWEIEPTPANWKGRGKGGMLPGIATYLWRRDDGIEFSILISGFARMNTIHDDQFLKMIAIVDEDITQWPAHDLFGQN